MKITEEILEKIERYLGENMNPEEKEAFEVLIAKHLEIQEALDLNKDIDGILLDKQSLEIEDMTTKLGEEYAKKYTDQPKEKKPKSRINPFLKLLLMILIGLVGYFVYVYDFSAKKPADVLYSSYYEPYTKATAIRSNSKRNNALLLDSLLEMKQYAQLIESIDSIQNTSIHENIDDFQFYKAMAFIELNNFQQAKNQLRIISTSQQSVFKQASLWYLALIHVKEENLEQAKELLESVTQMNSKGRYFNQATSLLKALK